jgi:hypothetical protein
MRRYPWYLRLKTSHLTISLFLLLSYTPKEQGQGAGAAAPILVHALTLAPAPYHSPLTRIIDLSEEGVFWLHGRASDKWPGAEALKSVGMKSPCLLIDLSLCKGTYQCPETCPHHSSIIASPLQHSY